MLHLRAARVPLRGKIQRHMSDSPVLRNETFPMGLPGLKPLDQQRVDAANAIYFTWVWQISSNFWINAKHCGALRIPETPCSGACRACKGSSSWVPWCNSILAALGVSEKTLKGFLSNVPAFRNLAVRCSGGHPHKPLGRVRRPDGSSYFATKDEAAYPELRACKSRA